MNREEAIHFAECLKHNWTIDFNDMEDFCDMAIEALSPRRREEATEEDSAYCDDCEAVEMCMWYPHDGCQFKVSRPKGEWIFNPTDAIDLMFTKPKCSECGFESADGGNFCSNCGARMKGGAE